MAVQLSSYYWFRNNSLVSSLEDVHKARHFFGKDLSPEDKKALQFIVDELDKLKEGSHFQDGGSMINPQARVLIPCFVELKDVTSQPELAAAYLEGIHGIMKKYWVRTELYRQFGRCFDEIGVKPKPDTQKAINVARQIISGKRFGCLESMCWESVSSHMAQNHGAIPSRYGL